VYHDDYPLGLKNSRKYMRKEVKVLVPRYRDNDSTYSWQTPYWPGSGGLIGENGPSGDIWQSIWFDQPDVVIGHRFTYGFIGISRDQYGSPLGGVTMKLFHTVDDVLIDKQTSDANGNYTLTTPFEDDHYIVAQKTSAVVSGATLDNLIPAT
jgi:hypothetical protein